MNTNQINVPVERFRQLHLLAEKEGKTVSDVISDFVNKAIYDNELSGELPGWVIRPVGNVIAFEHPESNLATRLTADNARFIADKLDQMAKPAGAARQGLLDLDSGLTITRRGVSVRIEDTFTGASRTVARSVANDIANLLRISADDCR